MAFKPVTITPAAMLASQNQATVQLLINALSDMTPIAEQFVVVSSNSPNMTKAEKLELANKVESAQLLLTVIQGAN